MPNLPQAADTESRLTRWCRYYLPRYRYAAKSRHFGQPDFISLFLQFNPTVEATLVCYSHERIAAEFARLDAELLARAA